MKAEPVAAEVEVNAGLKAEPVGLAEEDVKVAGAQALEKFASCASRQWRTERRSTPCRFASTSFTRFVCSGG